MEKQQHLGANLYKLLAIFILYMLLYFNEHQLKKSLKVSSFHTKQCIHVLCSKMMKAWRYESKHNLVHVAANKIVNV